MFTPSVSGCRVTSPGGLGRGPTGASGKDDPLEEEKDKEEEDEEEE